jgi:copper chaperone CopZ
MSQTIHLTIEGMTCDHCLRAVRSRLQQTPGVEIEDVRIGSARIRLDEGQSSLEAVEEAIADEGYTAFRSDD